MRWEIFDTEQSIKKVRDFSKKVSNLKKNFAIFLPFPKKINFMDKMTGMMRDGPG